MTEAVTEPPSHDPASQPPIAGARSSRLVDSLPLTLRSGRLQIDARSVLGLALVAVLGAVLGGGYWWQARPQELPVPERAAVVSSATPTPAAIVVDVQGRVRRPGIVRLPAGSRAVDAIRAAGGVARGTNTAGLNLARVLNDGEQIVVGAPPPAGSASGAPAPPGQAQQLLDLNTATMEQLDDLPGVGPVLAQRILDFRTEHGRFTAIEELQEVPGIGPAKFASLKAKVRV